ncbi:hypothetical protein GRI97_08955 [Altererythrobacter xixiisoli]|uniref:Uncharacterized protein n=1 Tax=Croceibacterium xixiisoli TaxID=1476466 RepID=A0A6I4TT26_9SPHN|nr:right-handed parallel beta-helix repeat-containing protein [Croceibacterium xixiisoli]MXO99116.1 hypothetical protein [Croceibacterium xixiisoli]
MSLTRRSMIGLVATSPLLAQLGRAAGPDGEAADWPAWARTRWQLYDELAGLARRGTDVREFGARLDGTSDDADALERALAAGAAAILIPAGPGRSMRIGRQIRITRPTVLIGTGGQAAIEYTGREKDMFLACALEEDPTRFLGPIRLDNLRIIRPEPLRPHGKLLLGYNLRGVSVTRCTSERMGLVGMHHMLQRLRRYRRAGGSIAEDPALKSGFSATLDDLCEDLQVHDCRTDARTYMSQMVRFDFTRRVAISHCHGRFANVSWWGGGGRRDEGGDLRHPRRVRDVYVADSEFSHALGGIYGNNGQDILIARNKVAMVVDIGIDFEGCVNAVARDNIVTNAGNFCLATFFAAKNILFENNLCIQDGGATNIHLQLRARKMGAANGRTLLALRSAGFGAVDGAIEVAFRNNRFVWQGSDGVGGCVPSFFGRLEVSGNRFENVTCNLAYRRTGSLIVADNQLTFGKGVLPVRPVISGNAAQLSVQRNRIRLADAPTGQLRAIQLALLPGSKFALVEGNRIEAAADLPIVMVAPSGTPASVILRNNHGGTLLVTEGLTVRADGNQDGSDRPVVPRTIPVEFATADASPADSADQETSPSAADADETALEAEAVPAFLRSHKPASA